MAQAHNLSSWDTEAGDSWVPDHVTMVSTAWVSNNKIIFFFFTIYCFVPLLFLGISVASTSELYASCVCRCQITSQRAFKWVFSMVCFLSSAPSLCSSLLNKGPRLWVPLSAQPKWRAHPFCFQSAVLARVVTVPICLFYLLYFIYHCILLVSLKEAFKLSIIETRTLKSLE